MYTNLICLIGSCPITEYKTADSFTEDDAMDALKGGTTTLVQMAPSSSTNQDLNNCKFDFQQPLTVVWDEAANVKKWYILSLSSLNYLVQHC